jgi:hypothetical protein
MTTKGVRTGPHPKWHQKAMDMEDFLIKKIDAKGGASRQSPFRLGTVERNTIGRDKTRHSLMRHRKTTQGKENPLKARWRCAR